MAGRPRAPRGRSQSTRLTRTVSISAMVVATSDTSAVVGRATQENAPRHQVDRSRVTQGTQRAGHVGA